MSLYDGGFAWRHFYLKRIFRLMPCMLTSLVLAIGVSILIGSVHPDAALFRTPLPRMLFESLAVICAFQNTLDSTAYYYGAMWSLSIEEQFYAGVGVLAVLGCLLHRPSSGFLLRRLGLVTGIGAVVICLIRIAAANSAVFADRLPVVLVYLHHHRFDYLFAGVALYALKTRHGFRFETRPRNSFLLLGCVAFPFVFAGFLQDHVAMATYGYPLILVSFVLAVLIASDDVPLFPRTGFATDFLVFFGERSYALYIFHFTVFSLAWLVMAEYYPASFRDAITYAIMQLLLTSLIGLPLIELVFRGIEQPGIRLGRRVIRELRNRRAAKTTAAAVESIPPPRTEAA